MSTRKRPKSSITPTGTRPKRQRAAAAAAGSAASVTIGSSHSQSRVKSDPDGSSDPKSDLERLRTEFIDLFSDPEYASGVSNTALKKKFGEKLFRKLATIINDLTRKSRLTMSKSPDGDLLYNLVSDEVASKFVGLDVSARMVYQVIEKGGNLGVWTKDIRTKTNIQQQALTKIFKALETRKLIKSVKDVKAKSKKLYMLYNLTPDKSLTGGPWYTELEFDHEFISELRTFVMHCVRRMNGGKGVTLTEISGKMKQANVSRVQLNLDEVQQLVQTLAFDYMIEPSGVDPRGEPMFVAARKVTTMCDFKWWECLDPDFHFRAIQFEDGVRLSAHEPHHHTA